MIFIQPSLPHPSGLVQKLWTWIRPDEYDWMSCKPLYNDGCQSPYILVICLKATGKEDMDFTPIHDSKFFLWRIVIRCCMYPSNWPYFILHSSSYHFQNDQDIFLNLQNFILQLVDRVAGDTNTQGGLQTIHLETPNSYSVASNHSPRPSAAHGTSSNGHPWQTFDAATNM